MRNLTFKTSTFGCRVNQAETKQIEWDLARAGFQPALKDQAPDIFIINSCVVTKKAEKEVRQLARRLKRENPNSFLVLCGCGVNFWKKVGLPKLPVDLWIENKQKNKIAEVLKKLTLAPKTEKIGLKTINSYQKSSRLIIKIQDGCDRFCSFCIVPYLRGKPKSKKISQIIKEAQKAEKRGIKEIILSGINLGFFGQDTNESIPMLIKELLKKTKIPRISFGSIYPGVIDKQFIKIYKENWQGENGRLCRFFHLPLQSGSKKILKLMNRRYTLKSFKTIVKKIHRALPQALIGTDIIVGFPGEGEQEFRKTYKFLKSLPIFKFHIFRFSPREGTLAAKMEKEWGRVEEKVKKKRAKILKELGRKKYKKFLNFLVGKKLPVLVLEKGRNLSLGMADNLVLVKFSLKNKVKDKIIPVLITKVGFPYLIGTCQR